jgi:hypothetical protein
VLRSEKKEEKNERKRKKKRRCVFPPPALSFSGPPFLLLRGLFWSLGTFLWKEEEGKRSARFELDHCGKRASERASVRRTRAREQGGKREEEKKG